MNELRNSTPHTTDGPSHVRGHALTQPAKPSLLALATVLDLGCVCLIFASSLALAQADPAPRPLWLAAFAGLAALYWGAQLFFGGRTLGERAWGLVPEEATSRKPLVGRNLIAPSPLPGPTVSIGTFLTLIAWFSCFFAVRAWLANPMLAQATPLRLDAYLPALTEPAETPASTESPRWGVSAFYYSLGAWPVVYAGHPVLYSIPYEKGPPTRFIGHLEARWDSPDIRVTLEGPKTPEGGREAIERDRVRACLIQAASLSCLKIRELVLLRHIHEMRQAVHPVRWDLRWFLVDNPGVPLQERAQGFLIRAVGRAQGEERYVLVTSHGTHQAIILDYPVGARGERARDVLEEAIRSLRVSDDLGPGRAWVDRALESTHLGNLASFDPAHETLATVTRLTQAQALLVSKLSVDPGVFDAYYHLGGTALLVARYAAQHPDQGWANAAKPLVQSMYRYARDVDIKNSKMALFENFLLESNKY